MTSKKLLYLEAMRGIASIIVVFHHFCLAYLPMAKDSFPSGLGWTPLNIIINGKAAVTFFFVLSGFVLLYRFFQKPDPYYLVASSAKRLPRLMLPAGITIFVGYLILFYGLSPYAEAAQKSGSEWLATFGNAEFPDNWSPRFSDAMAQTLNVFVFPHSFYYNSNLWTMRPEFLGSLAVFAVGVTGFIRSRTVGCGFLVLLLIASRFMLPLVYPFLVGALLAFYLARWPSIIDSVKSRPILLATVVIIGMSVEQREVLLVTSSILIVGLMAMPKAAKPFSGRIGAILGEISFPLYLVHTLIILSVGSFFYTNCGLSASALSVIFGCGFAIVPFIYLERWWVPLVNRAAKKTDILGSGPIK